jgi:hypothetical protein
MATKVTGQPLGFLVMELREGIHMSCVKLQ